MKNEIEQVEAGLQSAGMEREAQMMKDIITRQHQRRGIKPWTPAGELPIQTLADTLRNWVTVFDLNAVKKTWMDETIGAYLMGAALKLQWRNER